MEYKFFQKGKTNWLFVALLVLVVAVAGGAVFYFSGQDVIDDSSQSKVEVKKEIPSQTSEICNKEISRRQPSEEEKQQCVSAGGEWNCGSVCVDGAVPETESGCNDFCDCVCPQGRECIKQGENLVYGFDKCCEGLTKVLSHTTCATCETYTCVNCGDGVCGEWETAENCPADCNIASDL